MRVGGTGDLDVICWGESVFAIQPNQCPVLVGCVIDGEYRVIGKGQFLVGLAVIVVKRSGMM